MKRPSFQFYPEDWLANANLRRCTHEEKGIWIDVMCLLHDQAEYGVVRWPLKELAGAVGTTVRKLRNLIEKGVLKGCESGESVDPFIYVPRSGRKDGPPVTLIEAQCGPLWFSSRMVTDEYKRLVRGGDLPSPKVGLGDGFDGAPKATPSTRAPGQAPRAAPPSPSPSPSPIPLNTNGIEAPATHPPRAPDDTPRPPDGGARHPVPTTGPSMAGAVCVALRSTGMASVNPSHPELLALLKAGAPLDAFVQAASTDKARSARNGFAYVLATVKGQMQDAAAVGSDLVRQSRQPVQPQSFRERDRIAGMRRWEEATGQQHPELVALGCSSQPPAGVVIDIETAAKRIAV